MLADTLLLLRLYWTIDRRADSDRRRSSRIILIIGALALVGMSGAVGYFAASLTGETAPVQIRAEILPGLLLTIVLLSVAFTGFSQALQALYLSDDLDKLLVAPIRSQAVLTAKLLSRIPSTVVLLLVATIPALITFGLGAGLGVPYYLLGVLFVLLSPLFGISLGALLAIFMVRLLPARRLNEWVGAAAIVLGVLLSLLLYVPSMLGADQQAPDAATLASVEQFVNRMGDLPLPSMWAGRALVEMGQSQIAASALGAVGVYLLLTLGLFLVTVLVANRLYLSGWLRMQSSGSGVYDVEERPGMFGRASLDFTLGYKDWLLRIRDPRLLATLFTALVFAGISVFFILRPGDDGTSLLAPASDPALAEGSLDLLSAGVILSGLIYFVGWMMFYRTAITSLSIERSAFYILKTAPVSASRLLRAKAFGIVLPYAILVTLALVVLLFIYNLSPIWTPFGWLVLLIMGYGLFSYLVSVGFLYPNLDWDDPRRMINRKSGLPALIGSFVYSLVAVVVVVLTYVLGHGSAALAIPAVILGLSLLAGGTWLFVHWCTQRVEKIWPQIGSA